MSLKDTLTRLSTQAKREAGIKRDAQAWVQATAALNEHLVQRVLSQYIADGLLAVERTNASRTDKIGSAIHTYTIEELRLKSGSVALLLENKGMAVTGALGRIDVSRRGYTARRYYLLWNGNPAPKSGWEIADINSPGKKPEPFSKSLFETVLDRLIRQG